MEKVYILMYQTGYDYSEILEFEFFTSREEAQKYIDKHYAKSYYSLKDISIEELEKHA